MTTITAQNIAAKTWTEVTGLVNGTDYSVQNRAGIDMRLVESPTLPSVDEEGMIFGPKVKYFLTKGTDKVYVFFEAGKGAVVANEGA